MRILAVQSNMHPVRGGGGAERTLQMSRALAQSAGCQITVACVDLGGTAEQRARLPGVPLETLPCVSRRFAIPAPAPGAIARLLRAADVVHLMGHWGPLNALVYRQARSRGVPHVVCPAGALPIFGRSRLLKRAYNRLVGRAMVRDAAGHIAVSRNELAHFEDYGVPAERVRIIPNGVLPSEYAHRDDAGFRRRFDLGDAPLLLFIGRLSPIKGPDLLVEAFASVGKRIPHVLVMAGRDVGMGRQLAQLVDQHSLGQRVRFIGHVSGALKSAAYHAAELLVIPSRREAMSLVVLEGGVTGTQFLATDQCGLEELARAGGGLTVPATAAGVAGGITTMLADPTALRTMGENLRIVTLRDATWQAAAARLRELFEDILARRATGR